MFFSNSFYIASRGAAIFFYFRLFSLSTRFLSLFIIELLNLLPFIWMLWMLVTVHEPCYLPHASRITTWGTIFTEILFSVSKELVRSWSHVFVITYGKTFTKKLLAVRPEKVTKRKKRKKKTRKAIAKLFALNANAKCLWFLTSKMSKIRLCKWRWCISIYLSFCNSSEIDEWNPSLR